MNNAKPLISVTTATYNSEATVAGTMESVLAQDYGAVEYIVVDGASSDGTVEILQEYEHRFEERGFVFKWVSEPDRGMYEAINKGMNLAGGEVLGNVNSDDCYEPGALRKVAEAYAATGFDALQGNLRIATGDGQMVKRARPMGLWPSSARWNHPTLFLANGAAGYRYRIDNPYADFDLFLRVLGDGLHVEYLDAVLSNFRFGGMSTKKSLAEVRKRIAWKNQIFRDNGCPFPTYVEGVALEVAKYLKA